MNRFVAASLLCLTLTAPALADGKVYVQLPTFGPFEGNEAEDLLYHLVVANIVSSNCAGYEVTDAEWSLLTDSADLVAYGELKLSTNDFDNLFYDPAFDLLDDPTTCETEGPGVEPMLAELVQLGGSREPLPDQDKAYTEWRALMDRIQAEAAASHADAPPAGKTKTK
ncbi:hypothetical protein SAMN05428969_2491 [Devosia sp. YR412]|uniref:hypothetical protein n=1 Tax=Devosia sp. YR412 TaxID=1881030 RepID=UPI0008AF4F30|nr:hypothetical protein [Devosia sp. YR412]SEQ27025.1 hypothetical protein SAMN05428969_2491 [Devosia sp. YR412]